MNSPAWKVVDANALRRPLLEDFLTANSGNVAVITDFCCMETYKGHEDLKVAKSLSVLRKHPSQTIVLKSTGEIAQITSQGPVEREALVDRGTSDEFRLFCVSVELARTGHAQASAQLLDHQKAANEYLAKVATESAGLGVAIVEISASWPEETLARVRRGDVPTLDDIRIFEDGMLSMTANFLHALGPTEPFPPFHAVPHHFAFRFGMAGYLLAKSWIADGGVRTVAPKVLANDVVDMNYVAHATYFDGLISSDRRARMVYEEADWFMQHVVSQWIAPDTP
jgi:hypothetical protein